MVERLSFPIPEPLRRMIQRLLPLLLLAAAPAAAQEVSIPHTTFELPNGLRVIVAEDHSTPVAAVNVWYHVGSGYEQPGRTGFAHLFEHIMFEGSRNVAEGEFDNLLEAAGASNNGSTNVDRTNYYEMGPPTSWSWRCGWRRTAWADSWRPWARRSWTASARW
jgi:hypothetical protein